MTASPPSSAAPPDDVPPDSPPSPAVLAWAAGLLGASVRTVRALHGGSHASTHLLEAGVRDRGAILRRFRPGDPAPAREARVLTALDGLDGFAPRLLGVDPDGGLTGLPAVLITRLRGRADITPADPEAAARALGRALARLHAVPVPGSGTGSGTGTGTGTGRPDELGRPGTPGGPAGTTGPARLDGLNSRDGADASARHGAPAAPRHPLAGLRDGLAAARPGSGPAAEALAGHAARLARQPRVLTHSDYWSGNVLWQDGTLTGVVDWSGGCLAPRGYDIGWCRLDLALLHGPGDDGDTRDDTGDNPGDSPGADAVIGTGAVTGTEIRTRTGPAVADVFTAAYAEAAGEAPPDVPLWDLHTLARSHRTVETWVPNYAPLGRPDLTASELRRRHSAWTRRCLAAAAGRPE